MRCQERRRELHLTAAHAGVCGLPRRVASGGPLSADERRGNAPSSAGKLAWVKQQLVLLRFCHRTKTIADALSLSYVSPQAHVYYASCAQ